MTRIFHNGQPSHSGDRNIFEVITSTLPKVYSRKKSCTLNQISIFKLIMHMFLATLYQNYVKKMNNKNPHCRNQNSIENCKKWQNRYPNTQIHDISISWRGTGISI